ncbi:MAG: hypothetical protein ACK559_13955, partial [bacterium]
RELCGRRRGRGRSRGGGRRRSRRRRRRLNDHGGIVSGHSSGLGVHHVAVVDARQGERSRVLGLGGLGLDGVRHLGAVSAGIRLVEAGGVGEELQVLGRVLGLLDAGEDVGGAVQVGRERHVHLAHPK